MPKRYVYVRTATELGDDGPIGPCFARCFDSLKKAMIPGIIVRGTEGLEDYEYEYPIRWEKSRFSKLWYGLVEEGSVEELWYTIEKVVIE